MAQRGVAWRMLADSVAERLQPAASIADLDPLIRRMADARVVLLGEATHGTHEFYAWRAAITERLVEEHGFNVVAVEGDWPDCRALDAHVRGGGPASAEDALRAFRRWPTWMWANREVADLARWMRGWNEGHPRDVVSFRGLDVYSLWDSMDVVLRYLETRDPAAAEDARRAYACFEPYMRDEQAYARATTWVPASCEREVVQVLADLAERAILGEEDFDAQMNARVAANAEAYYRAMVRNDAQSWNLRDAHMMDTLDLLLERGGPRAKAIVWAHNTHVGDARATDMVADGTWNLGQLCRERYGMDDTFALGFTTHEGSVIAARAWGAPMERLRVPPAREASWEDVLHQASSGQDAWLLLRGSRLPDAWHEPRGQRAIGVVYHPQRERAGNYVPTDLPARYDAILHVDRSRALEPLHLRVEETGEPPETFPTGF